MNKHQKYINFIVADLVKKTEIDYEQGKIKFPFFQYLLTPYPFPLLTSSFFSFSNYVKERYGARDEEIKIIWGLYKERIKELIDNE